jgi:hypothetical protein
MRLHVSNDSTNNQLEFILRPTVSRPVCPDNRPLCGTSDQLYFFFNANCLETFAVFYYGASSLTRGRVSNLLLQVLLGLANAVTVGSTFRSTRDHILLSHLRLRSLFVARYDRQG